MEKMIATRLDTELLGHLDKYLKKSGMSRYTYVKALILKDMTEQKVITSEHLNRTEQYLVSWMKGE